MTHLVIDSSAFAKLFVPEDGSARTLELATKAEKLLAPDYIMTETANTLWKYVRWQGMPADRALDRLDVAQRYQIELVPSEELLAEALAIACELPHPLYDCLYLLLALRGGQTLATADARMRQAAERLGIRVEWVGAD